MKKNPVISKLAAIGAVVITTVLLGQTTAQADTQHNPCITNNTYNCPSMTVTAPPARTNLVSGTSFSVSPIVVVTTGSKTTSDTCSTNVTTSSITLSLSYSNTVNYVDNNGFSQALPAQTSSSCQITNPAPGVYTITMYVTGTSSDTNCSAQSLPCSVTENVPCGGGGSCGCSALTANTTGNALAMLDSLHISINLGPGALVGAAGGRPGPATPGTGRGNLGNLYVQSDGPSAQLATPAALQYSGLTTGVELLGTNGQPWQVNSTNIPLRQVNSTNGLADIVTLSPTHYEVRFYNPSQVGSKGTNGLYSVSGSALVTNTFWNPATDGSTNRLWFYSSDANGQGMISKFIWDSASSKWTLVTGGDFSGDGGARYETLQTTAPDGGYSRTEVRQITDAGSHLLSKRVVHYQSFGGVDYVVSETVDPDGTALTSTNNYNSLGQVTFHQGPDGSWESTTYDSTGRPTIKYSGFLNQGPTTNTNLCRVKTYYYDSAGLAMISGSGDTGAVLPGCVRAVVETLLGHEVSRQYTLYPSASERDDIQCQTPGAAWNAADNLKTVTMTYASGPFSGEVSSMQYPDGTMSFYSYTTNSAGTIRTNAVDQGQTNGVGTAIVDGTRTVTVEDVYGETLSRTVTDIASSGIVTAQVAYSDFDSRHRAQSASYLDGTTESWTYDCCGLASHTDRQGGQTSYVHDALKYPWMTMRDGVTMINVYDALGRVVSTTRQGTDSTTILLATNAYDVAGRMTVSWTPQSGLTMNQYQENGGGTSMTSTYADGGTRFATNAADGSSLLTSGTAVHGTRMAYGVEADGGTYRAYTKQINLNTDGTDSGEWVKSYSDMMGRNYKTLYADNNFSQSFYNNQGQLWKQVDPDGVVNLTRYNGKGDPAYTAVDLNQNDTIDFGGSDRINWTTNYVTSDHGFNVRRTDSYVWPTNSLDAPLLVSGSERAVNGLYSWNTSFGLTGTNVMTILGSGLVSSTSYTPYGTRSVSYSLNGRTIASTNFDASGSILGWTTNGYDVHNRISTVTDARNGTSTYAYVTGSDQVQTMTTPPPVSGGSGLATTTAYDSMGRPVVVTQPDSTSVTNAYYLTGERYQTYGSRQYPVQYTYDYAGRMATMTTWTNFVGAAGAAVTTWNYDSQRGWLDNKRYNDNTGPDYSYTPANRLLTRQWARTVGTNRLTTTYAYNTAGDLYTVGYNDGVTPAVTNSYTRLGQLSTVARDGQTTTLAYNDPGQPLIESYTGGPLDGLSVTNGYDQFLRRTNLSLLGSSLLASTAYGYDAASRLQTVSDDSGDSATYGYLTLSPLVGQIVFSNATAQVLTTTKQYDYLNRLTQIASLSSASFSNAFNYQYNQASQRTNDTLADGSHWNYQYDVLGQVTNAWKYDSTGTVINDHRFGYKFDDIGNRDATVTGNADATFATTNYTSNLLNQYAAIGAATPVYDADGNMVSDGQRQYVWDGENRLLSVTNGAVTLSLAYDSKGRRIQKMVAVSGVVLSTNRFIYDGWNLIAGLNPQASVLQSFMWGNDLSGSLQGAGGVGGLLAMNDAALGTHFYTYDGNGNVMATVSATDGSLSGQWEYGAFGETLSSTGTLGSANPFLFSTKFADSETGLYYYGYRYYDPSTGRWPSRDPLQELGDLNLYGFVQNNTINNFDALGQFSLFPHFEVVVSVEGTVDLCSGDLSGSIWIWIGKGNNITISANPTWTLPIGTIKGLFPHFNCKKCKCCSGLNSVDFSAAQLGGFMDIGKLGQGGLLISKAPCGVQVEFILLADLLPLVANSYPPLKGALWGAGLLGFEVKGGIQVNTDMDWCHDSSWHLTKGHAGLGGFIEVGYEGSPIQLPSGPRHFPMGK